MEYSSLYDLITYLQYGTKLHIGVLFFGNYGNEKCMLPKAQTVHTSRICREFKRGKKGFKKCFRCRNAAINKAHRSKESFGGLCVNGVYEYTRPIVINGDVASMIFIGNILDEATGCEKLRKSLPGKEFLLDTMEKSFTLEQCESVGALLETYIRTLLENIAPKLPDSFNPLIENIKNYIEANLEYDIKIAEVARSFSYNEQYLGRIFKKETGLSFCDYINKQRLERAKKLLKETGASVTNIANAVGFNNVTYFNRIFKRSLGVTPSQFRKENPSRK